MEDDFDTKVEAQRRAVRQKLVELGLAKLTGDLTNAIAAKTAAAARSRKSRRGVRCTTVATASRATGAARRPSPRRSRAPIHSAVAAEACPAASDWGLNTSPSPTHSEKCLWNRHGEDVEEANCSGNWVCPTCWQLRSGLHLLL
ncbi:hypothetical protein VaNZ11_015773 [Volvox africanus]|uniref:Zinc-finger domain-containing protein n=1 Tax=Volvox africanus TaxID=51714 RepID=A0ABQ5SNQ0_9CHLO|nr:hypothetical protein VaNZ11_015773 [Volvox africanus]